MLSNIFRKQPVKISGDDEKKEFFNLKQFRANFKREAEVQKERKHAQMSMSRYSNNKNKEIDNDSSYWFHDRHQQSRRFRKSPEGSQRNNSFLSSSQIHVPNFIKETDRYQRDKRYSLQRNVGFEKNSFASKIKDTSTLSKYSVRSNKDSNIENRSELFKGMNQNLSYKPISQPNEYEPSLHIHRNMEKVKSALNVKAPFNEPKANIGCSKEVHEQRLIRKVDRKNDDEGEELASRIQKFKDKLDVKIDFSSKFTAEPVQVDKYASKKTSFRDYEVTKPAPATRKITRLEQKLPLEDIKMFKETFQNVDTFELNQLPNK